MKYLVLISLAVLVVACSQGGKEAEMYEASELASLMRDMVKFSKETKENLENSVAPPKVPDHFWNLPKAKGTRNEHLEDNFQSMTGPYLEALKGLERGDSNTYYYKQSINACKSCHSVYCGGPMQVIKTLE